MAESETRSRRLHERIAVALLGAAIAVVGVLVGGWIGTLGLGVGIGIVIAAVAMTVAGRSIDLAADKD